jgi:hypothetical protein
VAKSLSEMLESAKSTNGGPKTAKLLARWPKKWPSENLKFSISE